MDAQQSSNGSTVRRLVGRPSLVGRVALITGGSRGLGLVLARELLKQGARVAICARQEAELEQAAKQLASISFKGDYLTVACDVGDPAQVSNMVEQVERELGPIDILINNAGVIQVGPREEMSRDDYEQAMRVHFWGPHYTVEQVVDSMKERRFGRIVNISSIGGRIAVPHMLPYSSSKFALTGYSRGIRAELARYGIRVTTVYPGLMRTGSPRHARFKGKASREYAWFSVGDSIPGLTVPDGRAARRIIRALQRGQPELVVGWPYKAAVKLHDLFPGTSARLAALVTGLLPAPDGMQQESVRGAELPSPPYWLIWLTERAARRNNEMDVAH